MEFSHVVFEASCKPQFNSFLLSYGRYLALLWHLGLNITFLNSYGMVLFGFYNIVTILMLRLLFYY
jgi:hypothetical protein